MKIYTISDRDSGVVSATLNSGTAIILKQKTDMSTQKPEQTTLHLDALTMDSAFIIKQLDAFIRESPNPPTKLIIENVDLLVHEENKNKLLMLLGGEVIPT